MTKRPSPTRSEAPADTPPASRADFSVPFFGRRAELKALRQAVADNTTRGIVIVGHEGMGKSTLLTRFAAMAKEHDAWGIVAYQTYATDGVDVIVERMIEDAYDAARTEAGSFADTDQRQRQWSALFKAVKAIPVAREVAELTEAIRDLAFSLKRDLSRGTRDQFLERLRDVSARMPAHGRAVFVIDPDPEMPEKSDQLWASVLRELPDKMKFIFAQRPGDALVSAQSRFHELERCNLVRRIPDIPLGGLDDVGWDDFLNQSALRLKLGRESLERALSHYDRHPYCITAAVGLIEQGEALDTLPPDPVGIAKSQYKVASGRPNGEQAADVLEAYAILDVPAPDTAAIAAAGFNHDNVLTRWRNDPFVGTLIVDSPLRPGYRHIYHRILSAFVRSQLTPDREKQLHERAAKVYRDMLAKARKQQSAPDPVACERAFLHVEKALGVEEAIAVFVNECTGPLITLGLLDVVVKATEGLLNHVEPQSEAAAALHGNLGVVLRTRGDLDGAEKMHRKALEIDKKLGRLEGMANSYGNLGIVFYIRGDLDGAEEMYRKALVIEEKLGRLEGMANQYGSLGNVLSTRGELDGAEEMHRKALEINEKLGRLEGMAANYGNLGIVLATRGDLKGAEEMFRNALAINDKLGRLEGMASQYGNLGIILATRGDLDGAEEMYRKALAINEKLGRLEGMADNYGNLGIVLATRGDLDGAEEMHRKALEIDEKLGRLEGMAIQYGNLGIVLRIRGDLVGAETMYRKALAIEEKLGRLEGMANDYGNLGILMEKRGRIAEAREHWITARDVFARLGAQHMAQKMQGWIDSLPQ